MLSYLKDENTVPASADMPENNEAASNVKDYMTVSGQSQKLRKNTMILVAVSVVGALGLWFMVKKSAPAKADAKTDQNQVQLDAALAQLNSMQTEVNTKMNSVAGRFSQFENVNQVGVDELKKNPFDIRDMSGASKSNAGGTEQQHEQIRQEAQVIQMGMELWSITETPKGMCCMIDDKVLYQGDSYRNMTVKSISAKSVTLEYKGIDIELKID